MSHPPFIDYRRRLKRSARTLRRDPTPAERKLWFDFLRDCPAKFTRQKPLANYIADFYCASQRLVIELDGHSHFNDSAEDYDRRRTADLASRGLTVLRFTNLEVTEQFEGVCQRIRDALEI
jgi:very-short-patch-repair endonuclease